mmetsp:Transcript_113410/g.320957  ORF Transcript_113410/g.320957 Transcript_113410/m.320957 type:complete len:212 (+) Transcript_113410:208-843(+)
MPSRVRRTQGRTCSTHRASLASRGRLRRCESAARGCFASSVPRQSEGHGRSTHGGSPTLYGHTRRSAKMAEGCFRCWRQRWSAGRQISGRRSSATSPGHLRRCAQATARSFALWAPSYSQSCAVSEHERFPMRALQAKLQTLRTTCGQPISRERSRTSPCPRHGRCWARSVELWTATSRRPRCGRWPQLPRAAAPWASVRHLSSWICKTGL